MNTIILTRGIPGSGKSTWAKTWVEESPLFRIRINWDDIRRMLGVYWVPSREFLLSGMTKILLEDAMSNGYDIVVDNMNLTPKSIEIFLETAKNYSYKVEYKDFKTPLEECLRRNSLREGDAKIDENVIRNLYEKNKWFYQEK